MKMKSESDHRGHAHRGHSQRTHSQGHLTEDTLTEDTLTENTLTEDTLTENTLIPSCGASVGFLTRYDGELREPLVWRQGSQGFMSVAEGARHCPRVMVGAASSFRAGEGTDCGSGGDVTGGHAT